LNKNQNSRLETFAPYAFCEALLPFYSYNEQKGQERKKARESCSSASASMPEAKVVAR